MRLIYPWVRLLLPLLLVTALLAPVPAAAQEGPEVYASSLNAPRGMVWDPVTNRLIVADAGYGGDVEIETPLGPATYGQTGRILAIGANGQARVILDNLPSVAGQGGAEVTGVHGVALDGRTLYFVTDGHGDYELGFGALWEVNLQTGDAQQVADLAAFEAIENPDQLVVDSNPYDVDVASDGSLYVVDAGGNTVLWINEARDIYSIAVIPGAPVPFPNPQRAGEMAADPVPTGIAIADDGTAYVTLLTGFPFATGAAVVYQAAPDGTVTQAASGLSLLTGVAIGPDGGVYVIEMAQGFDLTSTPPGFIPYSGRVLRLTGDGGYEVVADGLNIPTAIAFNPDGDLFVAVNGAFSEPGSAQILRWPGVAQP